MEQGRDNVIHIQCCIELSCGFIIITAAERTLDIPAIHGIGIRRKIGGAQITGCNSFNFTFQIIVNLLLGRAKLLSGCGAKEGRSVVIEQILQVELQQKLVVFVVCIGNAACLIEDLLHFLHRLCGGLHSSLLGFHEDSFLCGHSCFHSSLCLFRRCSFLLRGLCGCFRRFRRGGFRHSFGNNSFLCLTVSGKSTDRKHGDDHYNAK